MSDTPNSNMPEDRDPEAANLDGTAFDPALTEPAAPEAAEAATEAGRRRLTKISSEAYRHPLDRQAAVALRALPGFETLVAKFSQYSVEKIMYHEQCATSVRVTPRQLPKIHNLLLEACGVLDLPEPAMFVSQTPLVNAFALGRDNPTLVLWTGLIELLNEEETLAVIAHELGHIHCGHTLPLLIAVIAQQFVKAGGNPFLELSLQAALLEWIRKAEFSADRAALLVVQDPEVVFSALFKMTGGSPKIFEQMDREEFLKQAEDYERPDWSRLDKFYQGLIEAGKSHPIPVLRAREALRWGASDEYKAILTGEYLRRDDPSVTGSGLGNWWKSVRTGRNKAETPTSGANGNGNGAGSGTGGTATLVRPLASATRTCPNCGAETDAAFSFCTNCGRDLPAETPAPENTDAPDSSEGTEGAAPDA